MNSMPTDLDILLELLIFAEDEPAFELYVTPFAIGLKCAGSLFTFSLYEEKLIAVSRL